MGISGSLTVFKASRTCSSVTNAIASPLWFTISVFPGQLLEVTAVQPEEQGPGPQGRNGGQGGPAPARRQVHDPPHQHEEEQGAQHHGKAGPAGAAPPPDGVGDEGAEKAQ